MTNNLTIQYIDNQEKNILIHRLMHKVIHRGAMDCTTPRCNGLHPEINKDFEINARTYERVYTRERIHILAGRIAGCVQSCTLWFRHVPKGRRDVTANGTFGFGRSDRFLTCRRLFKKWLGK